MPLTRWSLNECQEYVKYIAPPTRGYAGRAQGINKLINKIGPKYILQYMAPQAAGTGLKGRGRSN